MRKKIVFRSDSEAWHEWSTAWSQLEARGRTGQIEPFVRVWWQLYDVLQSSVLRDDLDQHCRSICINLLIRAGLDLEASFRKKNEAHLEAKHGRMAMAAGSLLTELLNDKRINILDAQRLTRTDYDPIFVLPDGRAPVKEVRWITHPLEQLTKISNGAVWNHEALDAIPVDAHLIVQVIEGIHVMSFPYRRQERCDFCLDFPHKFGEKIQPLRRELERGIHVSRLESSIAPMRPVFEQWPKLTGRLYYVGIEVLSRLPISLFADVPIVRLRFRPRFEIKAIPRHHRGIALWSQNGPEQLINSKNECLRLDGFMTMRATRRNVIEALIGEAPVHLACHAMASTLSKQKTKIVLTDGELTAEEIERLPVRAPLVYLSACETGVDSLLSDEPTSLAHVLLGSGAGAVVATNWRIPDLQAGTVAEAFWGLIRNGVAPPEALHRARQALPTSHAHAFELHY